MSGFTQVEAEALALALALGEGLAATTEGVGCGLGAVTPESSDPPQADRMSASDRMPSRLPSLAQPPSVGPIAVLLRNFLCLGAGSTRFRPTS
ncbi:MAG: hypothetical protein WB801_03835 [Candidatus Dormiibacterota bacterium]